MRRKVWSMEYFGAAIQLRTCQIYCLISGLETIETYLQSARPAWPQPCEVCALKRSS